MINVDNIKKKFNIKQNLDNYCIVCSSLLSIFGLRKSRDIDIVSKNIIDNNKIDNHNSHYKKYLNLEADEIIFNPNNHMHFLILNLLFLNYYINLKNLVPKPQNPGNMNKKTKFDLNVIFYL